MGRILFLFALMIFASCNRRIVFLGKNDVPIFNYEICFECGKDKAYPYLLSTRCRKIDLFKDFFRQCNIHYGVDSLKLIKPLDGKF